MVTSGQPGIQSESLSQNKAVFKNRKNSNSAKLWSVTRPWVNVLKYYVLKFEGCPELTLPLTGLGRVAPPPPPES